MEDPNGSASAEVAQLRAENAQLRADLEKTSALLIAKDLAIAKANALTDAAAAALVHARSGDRAMGAAFTAMAGPQPQPAS